VIAVDRAVGDLGNRLGELGSTVRDVEEEVPDMPRLTRRLARMAGAGPLVVRPLVVRRVVFRALVVRAVVVRAVVVLAVVVLAGCSLRAGGSAGQTLADGAGENPAPAATGTPDSPTPTASVTKRPHSSLSSDDQLAGLRSTKVPWRGGGKLRVVPGHSSAPGKGRIYTVRVEVETGLDIDRPAFAKFVLATLNDKRSWTEHGRRRFARTDDSSPDIRVVLASPATSAAICLPLHTFGKLSCRSGANAAVLTDYRWVKAIPEYSGDHDGYRHYVINHEVGHVLGHSHEYCAGKGKLAPLMMQQTKGLKGCRPNPWPHP
jgi:hypothetical protein